MFLKRTKKSGKASLVWYWGDRQKSQTQIPNDKFIATW